MTVNNERKLSPLAIQLSNAFLQVKGQQEIMNFLYDLCTPAEIKSMEERLEVAKLLRTSKHSYREIHEKTGVSIATITRVARFLFHENYGGYEAVLQSLENAGLIKKNEEATSNITPMRGNKANNG